MIQPDAASLETLSLKQQDGEINDINPMKGNSHFTRPQKAVVHELLVLMK